MSDKRPEIRATCKECDGRGTVYDTDPHHGAIIASTIEECPKCHGSKKASRPMSNDEWLEALEIRVRAIESRERWRKVVHRHTEREEDE
jgi:RecJ-like exonuclease